MGGAYVNEATPIIIKTEIFFNIYLSRNYLEGTYSKKFTLFNIFLSSFKPRIGILHGGGVYTASGVLLMDVTNPKIGATQYSIFTSIRNFGDIGAASISSSLVAMLV